MIGPLKKKIFFEISAIFFPPGTVVGSFLISRFHVYSQPSFSLSQEYDEFMTDSKVDKSEKSTDTSRDPPSLAASIL